MTTPHERRPGAADVDVRELPLRGHIGPGAWHSVGTRPGADATAITWELTDEDTSGQLLAGAQNTDGRSVLLGISGTTDRSFESFAPEPFTLTSFNGASAGEARVFAGSIFGQSSPVNFGVDIVAAELRIEPHEEFVFVVDKDHAHAVLSIDREIFLEDISLKPETIGFVNESVKTLHIINPGDVPASALLLGGTREQHVH